MVLIMDKKIKRIRTIKELFTVGTIILGIITVVDFIIPDPIILVDEALLASLTGLFTIITSTLDDKEKELINGNNAKIKQEEVSKIVSAASDVSKNIKRIKKK